MDEFLIMVLIASLGVTEAEAKAIIAGDNVTNGEAKKAFNTKHTAKVAATKEEAKTEGYDKAKGETLTKFEADLKEKYGVKSNKKGLDLVAEVISDKTPDPAKLDSISPDTIKKSKTYLDREKELTDKVTAAEAATETKVKEVESKFAKAETDRTVSSLGVAGFKKLNPVLSADATKAAKQEALFTKNLLGKGYDFEVRDNGAILIKHGEGENKGKRVEDAHGNPLKFEDLIKETSDDLGFDYKVSTPRSGLGGKGGNGKKEGEVTGKEGEETPKYAGKMPTNDAEYVKLITDKSIPIEQRNEVEAYWQEQNKEEE